jgi:alkylhydroperoxidase/carboxymuconolactone decarboxylase family protein YurZ
MRQGKNERAITEMMAVVDLVSGMCKMAFGVGLVHAEEEGVAPLGLVVTLVDEQPVHNRTARVFDEIRAREAARLGREEVPVFWRAIAHRPLYLEATWNRSKSLLADGEVRQRDKEILGLAVAVNTGSQYFIHEHATALRRLGIDDAGIIEILGVVQYFDGLNRLTDGMHVESDIRPSSVLK